MSWSKKSLGIFVVALIFVVIVDQWVKSIFVEGFQKHFEIMSFVLTYNKGVAFSMFASLGEWLKYIQIALLVGVGIYFVFDKALLNQNPLAIGCIIGGGIGNVIDRFLHEGVVDYIYWHWGFEFAIFNLADVFINLGVGLLILSFFLEFRAKKQSS